MPILGERIRTLIFSLSTVGLVVSCGGDNASPADATKTIDAPVDAGEPPISLQDKEGGEIRLEWVADTKGTNGARATAFFYKDQTPGYHPLPSFPGCVDVRQRTTWPFAQGTYTPLDVGGVTIHSQTGTDLVLTSSTTGKDALNRPHTLWWTHAIQTPAVKDSGGLYEGDKYLPANQAYTIQLAGSSEWPAQTFTEAAFMPAAWGGPTDTMMSPPYNDDGVGAPKASLVAGTDLVVKYTPVAQPNLPAGYKVNYAMAFKGTCPDDPNNCPGGNGQGPIVLCQIDGTSGTFTVPAAMVDLLRQYSPGTWARQTLTHHVVELTDGSPRAVADRKRLDLLTVWCFNGNWQAAP
ncbi:hypothetical protein BH11MYX1_BH11MYX1_33140 [soil metagenome]